MGGAGVKTTSRSAVKIVLVDDEIGHLNPSAIVLTTHGYDVECIATAAAGERCLEIDPDLVLIGLHRDTSHSFRLAHSIRHIRPGQRVGFFMRNEQFLCKLSYEGEAIRDREGADDLVRRVAEMLRSTPDRD